MPGLEVRSVAHEELKPRDKMVTRMTRDGAVEDNLTEGTSERVSKRLEDAQLIAPHDAEPGDIAEEVRRRRQLRPDELENAEGQTKAEMQSTDTVPEYKPGELPVSENAASYSLHPEVHHTPRVDYGKAFADSKSIDVKFSDFRIMRHPTMDGIYGVILRQKYKSDRYADDGYLFLLWDFRNESMPCIHVRTWQPSVTVSDDNDIISIGDFNLE